MANSFQKFGCSSIEEFMELSSRNHCVEVYCSEAEIQIVLCRHYRQIVHFAFILHDRDEKEDGTLKTPHFHICLHLNNVYKIRQVIDWFKEVTDQNVFCELMLYKTRAFQYLCHQNSPDKYQYPENEVVTDLRSFWYDKEAKAMSLIYDLLHGADQLYMCNTYGREWIVHHAKYTDMARALSSKVQDPFLLDGELMNKTDYLSKKVYQINYEKVEVNNEQLENSDNSQG